MTHSIAELEQLLADTVGGTKSDLNAWFALRAAAPSLAAELLAMKQRERWIPTSERLPQVKTRPGGQCFSDDVLTLDDDGDQAIEFFFDGNWSDSTASDHWHVTHWRELPAPPASDTKAKEI